MKIIKFALKVILTISTVFAISQYFRSYTQAYTCAAGYYCNTNGGTLNFYQRVSTGGNISCFWSSAPYSCTGNSSSCNGGTCVNEYSSIADCKANKSSSICSFCCDYRGCDSTCQTCTASCGTGYSSSPTGCSATNFSCSNPNNGCGDTCPGNSRSCYLIETNNSFIQGNGSTAGPASINMIVDGKTYSLSSDPSNPTKIKLPAISSTNVQLSVPTFLTPSIAKNNSAGYQFMANNYGSNNEWKTWATCSGIAGEDFCTTVPNTNNTQNFVPTSKTVNQVLKEGATGEISAMYTTTDKCTETYKYSLPTKGYYVVDYAPRPPEQCTPGDAACPWIPEVSTNTTARGCSSLTYSGIEANNELHINADVTDTDNINEIQAFTLWFSKDTNVPAVGTISASYTGSVTNDVGIMIKRNGEIYATNSNLTWGQIALNSGVGYINVAGTNIIEISSISVTQDTKVTFDYKIKFLNTPSNLSGIYNVYGGSLDTHMINGNILDQSYYYKFFNWGVDLLNPTVEEITQQIIDPKNTYMTWSNADVTSGIGRTVINAYRLGGVSTDTEGIKLFLPAAYTILKGAITLDPNAPIPADQEIGLYNDPNAWKFDNNTGEKDKVNVGNNESGKIALYITAYDVACNTNGTTDEVDLNPWFATRGATVYSQGNISTTAKPVAGLAYLDGVFSPRAGMNSNLIDLGTEMLSTRNTTISNLLHSNSGATVATEKEDSNNTKGVWYEKLLKKFHKYEPGLTSFSIAQSDTAVSNKCTGRDCYMYSTEDITIPAGYACDKNTVFISEKDIHIEPSVQSNNNVLSGCIFLAKNNIYVDSGSFQSSTGTKVQYDYIEGYLIADNQIIFPIADETETLRDAVEIFGGMVAFGSNPPSGESAVSIKRNLRLYSQINPTVVLTYDNKYSVISTTFFGTESNLYKQEVGFKSF